jgi:hypothetical protein
MIEQVLILPITVEQVYRIFIAADVHKLLIGAPARIEENKFSFYDGKFTGFLDETFTNNSITMRWRDACWKEGSPIFYTFLTFERHIF